jgi:cysteinyl-tRNA synthetase
MNEDFNTPTAIEAFYEVLERINMTTIMEAEGMLENSYQTTTSILTVLGLYSAERYGSTWR